MGIVLDANIFCRLARGDDPQHRVVKEAVDCCLSLEHELLSLPQAEREFWVVATRPREKNGLGLSPDEAESHLRTFEIFTTYKADTAQVHECWKRLVLERQISGKDAHDAGYVTAMMAHGCERILTRDADDFRRHTSTLLVLEPTALVNNPRLLLESIRSPGLNR